jgi:hypothetical protein
MPEIPSAAWSGFLGGPTHCDKCTHAYSDHLTLDDGWRWPYYHYRCRVCGCCEFEGELIPVHSPCEHEGTVCDWLQDHMAGRPHAS